MPCFTVSCKLHFSSQMCLLLPLHIIIIIHINITNQTIKILLTLMGLFFLTVINFSSYLLLTLYTSPPDFNYYCIFCLPIKSRISASVVAFLVALACDISSAVDNTPRHSAHKTTGSPEKLMQT